MDKAVATHFLIPSLAKKTFFFHILLLIDASDESIHNRQRKSSSSEVYEGPLREKKEQQQLVSKVCSGKKVSIVTLTVSVDSFIITAWACEKNPSKWVFFFFFISFRSCCNE